MKSHLRLVENDQPDYGTLEDIDLGEAVAKQTDGPNGPVGVKAPTPLRLPKGVSQNQANWLQRGLTQPGGKLPLFDDEGQRISERTIKSCLKRGWAEPWFANPMKPDWLVCKITDDGRAIFDSE